jgi:hypothetical protein
MSKICPSCQRPASGRFCSHCGASVTASAECPECSAELPPSARFCNQCGAPATPGEDSEGAVPAVGRGARAAGGSQLPWLVAGVAVVVLLGMILLPRLRSDSAAAPAFGSAPPMGAPATGGGPQGIDLASMTPREAADRLFDRIMRTASGGDSAQAASFVPMALDAYQQVPDPDLDAHYHVGVLHLLAGDAAAARESANTILTLDPNHLFGLITAAQAEQHLGNNAAAETFFRRFLDNYPTEIARDLPEYSAHAPALPEMQAEAQAFLRSAR